MKSPLRVCIDARIISGSIGGIEQVLIGLATGFSGLRDGDEEYLFMTIAGADGWLRPYVQGPCQILEGPPVPLYEKWKQRIGSTFPTLRYAWHRLHSPNGKKTISPTDCMRPPRSDGLIEKAGVDIIHFATSGGFLTDVPSIYSPHDLQHLHFPQFFNPRQIMYREVIYRAFCAQARMVIALSSWGKFDLIEKYNLPPEKLQVIPWAPVLSAYPNVSDSHLPSVRKKFSLPELFIFYPAQTWPHKNHIALLDALALLRDRFSLTIPLVSSGTLNDFFFTIKKRVRNLRLGEQVRFLGFVSPAELKCLYRLCRCVIFPTRFEGFGMPLVEALSAGAPIACSKIPVLTELAGDAALLFDPDSPGEIADAIRRLVTNEPLRKMLVERGRKQVGRLSWERTARMLRAHYRRLSERPLSDEDYTLIHAPPLPSGSDPLQPAQCGKF